MVTKSRQTREMLECIEDIRVGARDEERIDVFPAKEPNSQEVSHSMPTMRASP